MACHHRLWEAQTVEGRGAWRAIIAFGLAQMVEQHPVLHDIIALGLHVRSDDVRCGMTSLPLDNTQGGKRQVWLDITALGQHTRSATSGGA